MKFRKVTADEVQVPPQDPHRPGGSAAKPGYWFASCSCGWKESRGDDDDDQWAACSLDKHRQVCAHPLRALMVPMWSVAWPWYWSSPETPFGLEMAWRPLGFHSSDFPMFSTGNEPQRWHLFAETKQ